jgi:polysaccharide biosynthesis/export protein
MKTYVLATVVVALCATIACGPKRAPSAADATASASGAPVGINDDENQARIDQLIAQRRNGGGDDAAGYRIGPDDLLEIRIPDLLDAPAEAIPPRASAAGIVPSMAGAPTFAQGMRVSAAGDVTVPHLGQVRADGLTPTQLEADLARRLVQRGLLRNPQVSVAVVEYRSRVVAVVGAVERPGVFPVTRPGATVGDLIWAAGGPSKDAGRLVQLMPGTGSAADAGRGGAPVRLDLETLLNAGAAASNGIPVRPGDVISLGPAGSIQVQGWVEKPGSYVVTRGLRLSGAVAAAGGPHFAADRTQAEVLRVLGTGQAQRLVVNLEQVAQGQAPDPIMIDGDVVSVPASSAKLVPWGVWNTINTMVRVGGTVF